MSVSMTDLSPFPRRRMKMLTEGSPIRVVWKLSQQISWCLPPKSNPTLFPPLWPPEGPELVQVPAHSKQTLQPVTLKEEGRGKDLAGYSKKNICLFTFMRILLVNSSLGLLIPGFKSLQGSWGKNKSHFCSSPLWLYFCLSFSITFPCSFWSES